MYGWWIKFFSGEGNEVGAVFYRGLIRKLLKVLQELAYPPQGPGCCRDLGVHAFEGFGMQGESCSIQEIQNRRG